MTVADLRCDRCGAALAGPVGLPSAEGRLGVRFAYHPGVPELKDDSGLMCEPCWAELAEWLGPPPRSMEACARCQAGLEGGTLIVSRPGEFVAWPLCRDDAVAFLNGLRTVEPKLDPATFAFPNRDKCGRNP